MQDGTDYAQIPEVLVLADDMLDAAEGVRGVVLVGGGLHAGGGKSRPPLHYLQATFAICCWLHAVSLWSISWLQWKELGLQITGVGVLYLFALFDQETGAFPQDHSSQMCGQTLMRILADLVAGLCNLKDRDNNPKALLVS